MRTPRRVFGRNDVVYKIKHVAGTGWQREANG